MTRSIGIVAAGLLVVIGIWAYVAFRHRPQEDLSLTIAALHHVTSWHEEYEGPGGLKDTWDHRISDMVCPDGIRVIMDETDAASVTTHQEYFYTPKSVYYRRVGGWVRISNRTSADECGSTPDLDALGIRMRLEDIFSGASIRAGDERMLDSETCRDYHVKVAWREFLICVNPTDHLPREIVSSLFKDENGQFVKPERARYSKWNSVQESDLGVALPSD